MGWKSHIYIFMCVTQLWIHLEKCCLVHHFIFIVSGKLQFVIISLNDSALLQTKAFYKLLMKPRSQTFCPWVHIHTCVYIFEMYIWKYVCMHAQLCQILCNPMNWPVRLLCAWDFPGKNTGVGCRFLLQGYVYAWHDFQWCCVYARLKWTALE